MKRTTFVYVCLVILVVVTTSSFAIYKSSISGIAEAQMADVKVYVESDETSNVAINPDNLTMDYDFYVDNYITENSITSRNEVVCDYYIKIVGLDNGVINNTLYYADEDDVETALTKEVSGAFAGYYKAPLRLAIDENKKDHYIIRISVDQANLLDASVNVSIDIGYEQYIEQDFHVNAPDLADGFIPVVWDGSINQWAKTSASNPNWYDYKQKKWANVVTAANTYSDGTNSNLSYNDSPDGTPIPTSDITTMFVWIPRFVYRIRETYFHNTITNSQVLTEPPVQVHFSETEQHGGDNWNGDIIANNGTRADSCKESWTTHSAFQFGSTYLNGIWVAKFQASNSTGTATEGDTIDDVYIRPGVVTAKSLDFNKMFSACRNMETKNIYGWNTASSIQSDAIFTTDTNNLDSHLIKNSEWSALAYLTQSEYGYGETDIPDSDAKSGVYAGQSSDVTTVFTTNVIQSTTGNVYGVYDVASAVWDIVSASIGPGDNVGSSVLYNAAAKYKDVYVTNDAIDYSSKDSVYAMFEKIKDAAIWETSTSGNASSTAWFGARSNIGSYTSGKYKLLITRGGPWISGTKIYDSVFSFGYGHGLDVETSRGFRPVIVVKNGL